MANLITILLNALRATWSFIENVPEDDPSRTDKFFKLRAQVRNAFAAAGNETTEAPPSAGPADHEEIVEATGNLIEAAKLVVKRWESGNLAEAVQNLQMVASFAEYTLESLAGETADTWEYHRDGEHADFQQEDWRSEVTNQDTLLGYQEWVEHRLESSEDEANHE